MRHGKPSGHRKLWFGDAPDHDKVDVHMAEIRSFIFDAKRCPTAWEPLRQEQAKQTRKPSGAGRASGSGGKRKRSTYF